MEWVKYDAINGWAESGDGSPFWLGDDAAFWNSNPSEYPQEFGANGAEWAIQFRVDLSTSTGVGLAGQEARFTAGAVVKRGGATASRYSTIDRGDCGATCGDLVGYTDGFVHPVPAEWTRVRPLDGNCVGGLTITDLYSVGNSHGANYVSHIPGETNTFEVKFSYPEEGDVYCAPGTPAEECTVSVEDGSLEAIFKMSNWGTQIADSQAAWIEVASVVNSSKDPDTLQKSCEPNIAGANNACGGLITNVDDPRDYYHQCLQVQLRPVDGARIPMTRATKWINTYFAELSEHEEVAEINVKGLKDILGNDDDRELYFHIVPTNLPEAGDTRLPDMNVAGLNALRAQMDGSFEVPSTCSAPSDTCVEAHPGKGDMDPIAYCGHECGSSVEFPCASGETRADMQGTCYCFPYTITDVGAAEYVTEYESCTIAKPAGGGIDPNVSAVGPREKVQSEFATLMVYPYYASGETIRTNGKDLKELIPMTSFGLNMWHEGEHYGFLYDLIVEANEGEELGQLVEVEENSNYYKLVVPSESVTNLRVRVSAEEVPHYAPFSDVAGTARTWGWGWDSAHLTGVTESDREMDLASATVTLTSMLDDSGTELVAGLGSPVALSPTSGSTECAATYRSTDGHISMAVLKLPLVGYVTAISATHTDVGRPASCGWFGTAELGTEFSIDDQNGAPLHVVGSDQWTCTPLRLWNF